MFSQARNTLITGGTFNTIHPSGSPSLSAFERLEKATAHAGFHNSSERPYPPRCHPRTRLAIQAQIKAWILRQEDRDVNMMWLTGGAGAGKSAIAQCIAEQCEEEGQLAAGFFFGRSDPARNDGRKLIAAIAYQICLNIFGVQELIESAINHDPLIFTRSLASQMKALIIDPLQQLRINGNIDLTKIYVVIIDGLDECHDRDIQCSILTTIADALSQANLPLLFLVASRTESHLTSTMTSKKLANLHAHRILDETLSPDQDIEIFLRESFDEIKETHPLRSYIPSSWPSDHDIYFLVRKASGQFIYASVVIKYVKSPRRRPKDCLDNILGLRPNLRDDAPFAELDMLYHHILADVDDIEMAMHILSFFLFRRDPLMLGSTTNIEDFLGLSPGDIRFYLDSLTSIVTFRGKEENYSVDISHASFTDFLRDKTRSNQFFMDPPVRCEALAWRCFHLLKNTAPIYSDEVCTPDISEIQPTQRLKFGSFWFSQWNVEEFCVKSIPTPELCIDISEFSLLDVQAISKQFASETRSFQVYPMWSFVSSIETLRIEDAKAITNRHMQDMRTITIKMIEEYYANTRLTTLISIFNIIRPHIHKDIYIALRTMLSLGDQSYLDSFNLMEIASILDRDSNTNKARYLSFLQECVEERERNATHPLDHRKYTVAALYVLQFLSSYLGEYEARFHPRYSWHDLNLRRKYPWKWRRKRFGIHGTLTWSRLNRWRSLEFTHAMGDITTLCDPKNCVNTNVFRDVHGFDSWIDNSEAYELAVQILPSLLNRSDYNPALFQLAETIVFLLRLTKRNEDDAAQRAVQKYLHRWSTSF